MFGQVRSSAPITFRRPGSVVVQVLLCHETTYSARG